ncbi:unnamed protein product, partial [Hydatigera taeniaeformis]|uniref:Growth hormone receptor n=1 Tax=Hydatigena taeniaeformis TaxID=6205 RepID=A0A0R3WZ15_HYDTA
MHSETSFQGVNAKSGILEEDKGINSCRTPGYLLSSSANHKYSGGSTLMEHSGTSNSGKTACQDEPKNSCENTQYSFDYGQMAYLVPGVGYLYVNEVAEPVTLDKAAGPQVPPIPAPRASLLPTSTRVPPLDLSTLTQAAPSITTITTAPSPSDLSSPHATSGSM